MRRSVRTLAVCTLALSFAGLLFAVLHAATLSTTTSATQNFDGIGTSATATLPSDFRADKQATVRTVGTFSGGATATSLAGGANLSSSASNGIYNFGAGTNTTGPDRAVGFLSSGTATQSGNLYAQYGNTSGTDLTGLKISYDVEKYRLGINPAGFCIQLYYSSTGGAPWTSAGSSFLTTFSGDSGTVNSGYATAPGAVQSVTNQTLTVAVPNGSSVYLAWNYSVCSGSTTTNGQALAIDNIAVLGMTSGTSTPPSGTGSASPATVDPGAASQLTVTVTPGTNPVSSVTADLSSIGGSNPQAFAANGNVYTFSATVASGTGGGTKTLPVTITDSTGLTGTTSIQLGVTSPVPIGGSGSASPATIAPGAMTTLTVAVTPGQTPLSTGVTVTGDLTQIGGSAAQTFVDNGSGTSFSYAATVGAGTSDGSKSLPITVTDAQNRVAKFSIALNVATPFIAPSVKISQVYGGGGNSGATYLNDFVELFNAGATPVDVTNWSVQEASASSNSWNVAPLCAAGPCVMLPGQYFLVWESQGTGTSVQVPLPIADAMGTATMSATSAKVALMANTTPLTGICAVGQVVDVVGYGTANCFETLAAPALSNTTADVRVANGCTDTDNNSADFLSITPVPRNSASPPHVCGDGSHTTALGLASPTGPERGGLVTFTVQVTPAGGAPAAGFSVTGDLSSIGGSASQIFYDDGSNGDASAGDNTFSYAFRTPLTIAKGAHTVLTTVRDGQGNSFSEPITFTSALPTCGTERWSVKVGDDPDASIVDLTNLPTPTTIEALRGVTAPTLLLNPPYDPRFTSGYGNVETTAWVLDATMMEFKKETDVDYHIVIADTSGTMIAEIPEPDCASDASPFRPGIFKSRQTFDGQFTATPDFQGVSVPVRLTGVGFFDLLHGQTGVAPNGVELHPVLDITFQAVTTTSVSSSANPSNFQQDVTFTATVSSPGAGPTGSVTFFDGGTSLGSAALDSTGHASVHTSGLSVGPHAITAKYLGDENSTASTSSPLTQNVGKADQTITFDAIADKTFGDPDFVISASSTSGLGVTLAIASGPATLAANTVHITGAGTVTVRATQTGDANFNPASEVDRTFTIAKAAQTITFNGAPPAPRYGALPFDVTATGGGSGNPVTFTGNGACTAVGQNGIATVTIASGGDCHVIASQAGNDNYKAAPDTTETITVGRAIADVHVKPVTAVYDGQPHGLKGSATGVNAEDLTGLLNLGATFTNVPGGTASWSFTGNANYLPAAGQELVTISTATPAFSNLSAVTIEAGTPAVSLGGVLKLGTLVPTGTVAIAFNGTTVPAAVAADGNFSAMFPSASLAPSTTPVSFAYGGDGNFNAIAGAGSVRVVDTKPPVLSGIAATPDVLGPPNHQMVDVALTYQATDLGADGRTIVSQPSCSVSVASSEPVNGTGDGNTARDWVVVDATHLQLRAERAGDGSGRVYTVTVACADAAGNRSSASTSVTVPK
jgi:hypothetical protein